MGLGFAATRDIVSFLRHETADSAGTANPVAGRIDRAIGFGLSQSGRYLHDYLYLGFNADEAGRTVFDGLMPHISGGKKTFTNYRFSQPGRSPYQHADMLYPGADFPFTYPVITDALTGKSDGFLARCLAAGNCPKIIKTDSEIEFYQQRASLVVTDTEGNALAMPDNVRLFFLSNLQHNSRWPTPNPRWRRPAPSRPIRSMPVRRLRALLVALDAWISNGTLPPASRYPSRADGTLVPPAIDEVGFPRMPGFGYPVRIAQPTRAQGRRDAAVQSRRPIRCSCRRPMPMAAPSPACICRRWKRRARPTPAGTCARPVLPKANCATTTAP